MGHSADVTRGHADVTRGRADVTRGSAIDTLNIKVSMGSVDVMGGHADVTKGRADVTRGHADGMSGCADVTRSRLYADISRTKPASTIRASRGNSLLRDVHTDITTGGHTVKIVKKAGATFADIVTH